MLVASRFLRLTSPFLAGALLVTACSDLEPLDPEAFAGATSGGTGGSGAGAGGATAGQAGESGAAGDAGVGGDSGEGGIAGAAGLGGIAGAAGLGGVAGAAGLGGVAGAAGLGGVAGAAGLGGVAGAAGLGGVAGAAGLGGLAGAAGLGGAGGAPLALGPAPVNLGTAETFVILAQSGISSIPTSSITGSIGISPAAATAITGFSMTLAGPKWTSTQVSGDIFAADNDAPTPTKLTVAIGDMTTAYTDAAGRADPGFSNLGAGNIGGLVLVPGLYRWASSVSVPSDVTLAGGADDRWIFQITGDLALSTGKAVKLTGGAQPKNIVWQVAGAVDLGAAAHAEGVFLAKTAIKLATGASANGRLLAQTAVTLDKATVVAP